MKIKAPQKLKTPWFMPQNIFAHIHRILFFTHEGFFLVALILVSEPLVSLKLHFSSFPSSDGSWNSFFCKCRWGPSFHCRASGAAFGRTKRHGRLLGCVQYPSRYGLYIIPFIVAWMTLCTEIYGERMSFCVVRGAQICLSWYLMSI